MACSLSLCNSASAILEKDTQGGEERKTKTHAVVTQGNGWAPRGAAQEALGDSRGAAGDPLGVAGRAVRSAGSPRLSLRPPPTRPPGCAPAPPLTAAPGRGRPRQSGTWATGSRREGAPALRWSPALTSPRLAPPLGCGGPAATAPRGSRRAGDAGLPPRGRWGPQGADEERACG